MGNDPSKTRSSSTSTPSLRQHETVRAGSSSSLPASLTSHRTAPPRSAAVHAKGKERGPLEDRSGLLDTCTLAGVGKVSDDRRTISHNGEAGGEASEGTYIFIDAVCRPSTGSYQWTVVVDRDDGESVAVGVVSTEEDNDNGAPTPLKTTAANSSWMWSQRAWVCTSKRGELIAQGELAFQDNSARGIKEFSERGTVLQFTLDTDAGIFWMTVGSAKPAVLFHEICETVRPIIGWHGAQTTRLTIREAVKQQDSSGFTSISSLEAILQHTQLGLGERSRELLQQTVASLPEVKPSTEESSASRATQDNTSESSKEQQEYNPMRKLSVGFDRHQCHGDVSVSADGLTISRGDVRGNAYSFLTCECRSPHRYRWSFRVVQDAGSSSCIGIASGTIKVPGGAFLFKAPQLWVWRSYHGELYSGGTLLEQRIQEFYPERGKTESKHPILTIELDMMEKSMAFFHDGVRQPVEMSGFSSPVRPVVGFYSAMPKCIQVTEFSTSDPSVGGSTTSTNNENYNVSGSAMDTRDGAPRPLSTTAAPSQPEPLPLLPSLTLPGERKSATEPSPSQQQSSQSETSKSKSISEPPSGTQDAADPPSSIPTSNLNNLSCGYDDNNYDDPLPRFRQSRCVGTTLLPCNRGRTLIRQPSNDGGDSRLHDNVYAFLSRPCVEPGIYRWTLLIESDEGASMCVGVAHEENIHLGDKIMYEAKGMWLWRSFEGRLYVNGVELLKKLEEYNLPGSVVELTLDTIKGSLECGLDGVSLGEAFQNLKPPLTPVVAFYGNLTKRVMILDHNWPGKAKGSSRSTETPDRPIPDQKCHICSLNPALTIAGESPDTESSQPQIVLAQPCGHAVLCFEHAIIFRDQKGVCPRCDTIISGLTNIMQ